MKTREVGEVLERAVGRIERHLRRGGLVRDEEEGEVLARAPESNLAASAVWGQALQPQALA